MRAVALLSLVLTLVIACVFQHSEFPAEAKHKYRDVSVWVDMGFVDADKADIAAAVDDWDQSLNGAIDIHVVDWFYDMGLGPLRDAANGKGFLVLRITSDNPLVTDPDGKRTLGWVNDIGGHWMYLVTDRLGPGMVKPVTMHEMGHLLGVEHGGSGLMQPGFSFSDTRCVDEWTARAVERAQAIPVGVVLSCKEK